MGATLPVGDDGRRDPLGTMDDGRHVFHVVVEPTVRGWGRRVQLAARPTQP